MQFKNREEAGEKLVERLLEDEEIEKTVKNTAVVSLLRGGVVIGNILANKLKIPHYPLAVAKIPAPFPHSPELAVGAICGEIIYRDENIIQLIQISKIEFEKQVTIAKQKQTKYTKKYKLNKLSYKKLFKNKHIILTDDGVATGATIRAAALYINSNKPKSITLAIPVTPEEFDEKGFDKVIILHKDPFFYAVGQFYKEFPEVKNHEITKSL